MVTACNTKSNKELTPKSVAMYLDQLILIININLPMILTTLMLTLNIFPVLAFRILPTKLTTAFI